MAINMGGSTVKPTDILTSLTDMGDGDFSLIEKEILSGLEGRNSTIPMGFERLSKYVGLRKKIYYLIFGPTGSGKSALASDAFILNPFDYLRDNPNSPMKMKVVYFSMERSKVFTLCKWLSRKIFIDHGINIPMGKLLGWWEKDKLTHDEHDLVLTKRDYINELTSNFVDIIEGPQNPTGVYKYLKELALKNGKVHQINEFKKVYEPNNNYLITVPLLDHAGLTKIEKPFNNKKESIDKLSEYLQIARDLYDMSPVLISQINRDLNTGMQKVENYEPTVDHIKESGAPAEAADLIMSIFDPLRYQSEDDTYDAKKLVDPNTGAKYFRAIKILKSTYSTDSIKVGMVMHGAIGMFKELPKLQKRKEPLPSSVYEKIFDNSYFIK